MHILSESEVVEQQLIDWKFTNQTICKTFEFNNFSEAFAFMVRVAFIAEKLDHHPNWSNVYNQLNIALFTHTHQGVTIKDIELAKAIDSL
jgi:4a-hydroxytetrahydrobiopterin dehydratase